MTLDHDAAEGRDEGGDGRVVRRRHGALVEEVRSVVELDAVEVREVFVQRAEGELDLARERSRRSRLGNRAAPEVTVDAAERTLGADEKEGQKALRSPCRAALALDYRARGGERIETGARACQRPVAQRRGGCAKQLAR